MDKKDHSKLTVLGGEDEADGPVSVVEDIQDIDPAAYLAEDDSDVRGYVKVRTRNGVKRMAIAALTEAEISRAQKYATQPDRTRGKGATKFDGMLFKQMVVAMSLSKIAGSVIMPDHLQQKLSGSITTIADAVTKLSGFSDGEEGESDKALGFSG